MPLVSGASYATVAQFFGPGGLPVTALGSRSTADVQACLDTATSDIDSLAFRGVYGPGFTFSAVGLDVSRRCVQHARYLFLSEKGYSPETGADQDVSRSEEDFKSWCDRVHRRVEFPDVTISQSPAYSAQPLAISKSTINDLGQTAPNRGW
jgi:hypothetical protein